MADPTQQLQQMLNNAESSFGGLNSAGQQLAAQLLQAAKAGNTQTNAATATSQSLAQLTARSQSVTAGFISIGGAFGGLINQATNLTAGIYGADKAFTSVIPTVDAVASVLGKVITGMGQLGSGVTILGTGFGQASQGIANLATSGLEIVTNILKFQLETSQKVADAFISSAKAGAMFGGSISKLASEAARAGVPIQNLVKVVTNNVESLAKFGLGQQSAAVVVAGMTREIFDSNIALRALYGNFDELSTGVADYLASQAQLGLSAKSDYAGNKAAAIDYLYRQKELTAITGKNADLLKKEEEARRNQLDYNLKLSRLGTTARANVEEGMAIAGKIFGSEGVKYAEEYFATGGKVVTKASLAFQALGDGSAETIANILGGVNQSSEGFRTLTTGILQDAAPAMKAFAQSQEYNSTINRAANNEFIAMQTNLGSALQAAIPFVENIGKLYQTLEAERANMKKGPSDAATKAYTDAQNQLLNNQMLIDNTVLKNMESIGSILSLMNQIQTGFISLQAEANDALNKIIKGAFTSPEYVKELIGKILGAIQNPPTSAAPPNPPGVAPPTTAPPTTPAAPAPAAPPNPPGPVSQSNPPPTAAAEERVAAQQLEIEKLNREMVAIRNTPPPVNDDNAETQKSMLAVLRDSSDKLDRIRDALA